MISNPKLRKSVGKWVSFYRANPHRLVKDYLHINLKLFQKVLIVAMMSNNIFAFIASRGKS